VGGESRVEVVCATDVERAVVASQDVHEGHRNDDDGAVEGVPLEEAVVSCPSTRPLASLRAFDLPL
jgi:RecJ-like exonuclease